MLFLTTLHTHLYSTVMKNNTHELTSDSNVQHEMCMNPFKEHKSHRKRSGHSLCDQMPYEACQKLRLVELAEDL